MSENTEEMWVIGIGASAGGLEALSQFVLELPEKFPASIIIAQHLAPHAKSMMVELLSRKSNLQVTQAVNGLSLTPNSVIIIPPNFDLTIREGKVRLTQAGEETRPKPSIDTFFESLANEYSTKAIAVVLSGTGSDGSEGVIKIKEVGGVALAQDAVSAKYDGMPKAAAQTGIIDYIGTPSEIAQKVAGIILNDEPVRGPEPLGHPDEFDKILRYLKATKHMDFTLYKPNTLRRRLDKRMRQVGLHDMDAYRKMLESNNEEANSLVQEMLISVTSFFRDADAFASAQKLLAKILEAKRDGDELRIWVAGCASGEEPYSIGMILLELLEESRKRVDFKIFASDLDHEAIQFARIGIYRRVEVEASVAPALISKHFIMKESTAEVKKHLREKIVFARQDMIHHPPFVKIDLISCRNVLIYFKAELQHKVFDIFYYALNPGGHLFLGKSEHVPQGSTGFKVIDKTHKIYQKTGHTTNLSPVHVPTRSQATNIPVKIIKKEPAPLEASVLKDLLQSYELSAVLVDGEGAISQVFGDVSDFLSLNPGVADFKIANLLTKSIGSEVHLLLRKASKDGRLIRGRTHLIDTKTGKKSLTIQAKPFDSENLKSMYLISFELSKATEEHRIDVPAQTGENNELIVRLMELEQELSASKENLQAVVEELSVSNEELQSVNEELSSTNEEMQASNEELETTNEELQSTNEELTTLNEELNVKSHELRLSNSSLENIQASIGSPLVVVDSRLRVIRYNQLATKIFSLTINHIGKQITRISCNAEIPDFEDLLNRTISSGEPSQVIVEADRHFYQFQVHPCRDDMNKIIGAILIFFDNTEIIATEAKLKVSQSRVRSIIDGSPALIALKDALGKYLTVNRAFIKFFGLKEEEILGRTDREIFPDTIATQFRDYDLEVLLKKTSTENQERIAWGGATTIFLGSRFPLFDQENGKNPYALGIVLFDVTKQVLAQENLEASEVRYRALIEDQAVFVTRFQSDGVLTFVNNAFANFFGGTPESDTGKTFYSFVDSDKKAQIQKEIASINVSHPVITVEHTFKNMNRPVKWVRWILRGLFHEKELTEIQAVGFDVTESKTISDELREKERIFGSILSFNSDFLFVYRVVDRKTFELESLNRSAESSYVNANNAFVGRELKDFVDPDKYHKILNCFQKCLDTLKPQVYEETVELPAGAKSYQTTLVPILDDKGQVEKVASVSRDISKFKQVESALREEKKLADSASQSKSDFLASMSHELRTPLNVILGMSELLGTTRLDADQARYSESIKKSGKMLLSLIEDVLDLSKIESGKITFERRPFSLKHLCQEISTAFVVQATSKGLDFAVDCEVSDSHRLIGDENRIRQILVNLVSNAIKFTQKGKIHVRVTEDESKPLVSKLRFEVRDTGVGIPEESSGKLFTRFSQADSGHTRKFGGTGLGLAISKQLVDLMQGNIGFESEINKGSTFWFELQLPTTQATVRTKDPSAVTVKVERDRAQALRILIVDDYLESHPLMKAFFTRLGHSATLVASGKEAVALLEKKTIYDLIFMDIQMPDMDGMETTRRIRNLKDVKQVPIIALTANVMKGLKEEALQAGMDDFLTKPVSIASLKEKIDSWKEQVT